METFKTKEKYSKSGSAVGFGERFGESVTLELISKSYIYPRFLGSVNRGFFGENSSIRPELEILGLFSLTSKT